MTEDTSYNEDNLSEIDKTTVDLRRYVEMVGIFEKKKFSTVKTFFDDFILKMYLFPLHSCWKNNPANLPTAITSDQLPHKTWTT